MEQHEIRKLYEAYRMAWMVENRKTIGEIINCMDEYLGNMLDEGRTALDMHGFEKEWGFSNEYDIWADYNTFCDEELKNVEYINSLAPFLPEDDRENILRIYNNEFGLKVQSIQEEKNFKKIDFKVDDFVPVGGVEASISVPSEIADNKKAVIDYIKSHPMEIDVAPDLFVGKIENKEIMLYGEPKDIQELIKAGDWHINMENFLRCTDSEIDKEQYLGYVNYGNHQFQFTAFPSADGLHIVTYEQFVPKIEFSSMYEDISQTNILDIDFNPIEWMNFYNKDYNNYSLLPVEFFESVDYNGAENREYVIGSTYYLFESIDAFKRSCAEQLIKDECIFYENTDKYKDMKENKKGFYQQIEKIIDDYPSKLAKKEKLSILEIKNLTNYYDFKFDDGKEIVKNLVIDGFSDERIYMLCNDINNKARASQEGIKITPYIYEPSNLKKMRNQFFDICQKKKHQYAEVM